MATTRATMTLNSTDILSNAISVSASATLYKGGTTETGLEQMNYHRLIIPTGTNFDLIEESDALKDNSNYVYIINKNTDVTDYVTISINSEVIGSLYAGDWMFIPWSQTDTAANIEVVATNWTSSTGDVPIEYALFHEDTDFLTNA